jgi:uncharacterized alkaline shock family protein YloU
VPTRSNPGRSLATRQAAVDLVRAATLGSYGVTGFAGSIPDRLLGRLGLAQPGIRVHLGAVVDVDLDLTVAPGVPIAEVTRQVDSAVRYALRRSLDREVRQLTIHVEGLRIGSGGQPPIDLDDRTPGVGPDELADSGTDVA